MKSAGFNSNRKQNSLSAEGQPPTCQEMGGGGVPTEQVWTGPYDSGGPPCGWGEVRPCIGGVSSAHVI